jgi:hypothetical protein
MKQSWDKNARKFGVDIFMTISAIVGKFKIASVDLHAKKHKSSFSNLDNMFLEVTGEIFDLLCKNKKLWKKKIKLKKMPTACRAGKTSSSHFKPVIPNKILNQQKEKMDEKEWCEILYKAFSDYAKAHSSQARKKILMELKPFYFKRMFSYAKETRKTNQKEDEKKIAIQAKCFFKNRSKLLL